MSRVSRVTCCRFLRATSRWASATLIVMLSMMPFTHVAYAAAQRVDPEAARTVSDDSALLALVHDAQAEATIRRDAVTSLLDRGSPETAIALVAELKAAMEPGLRRALIQGMRASRQPPASSMSAILAIARELETLLLEDAGEVVGRAATSRDVDMLATVAADRKAIPNARFIATSALGYRRTQEAAKALLSLTQSDQSPSVRAAAFAALARITGLDEYGNDRERWSRWWSSVQSLTSMQWQEHLLTNFTRRSESLARQRAVLQERLMTALRQRYRAVARDEREGVLIAMLADPLDSVRLLAMDLIRENISTEQPGTPLTASLLTRLDDTTPAVRAAAVLLLRDLKNIQASDIVARRLAEEVEQDRSVLRAYLLMMKRQPHLAAIGPAIALLKDQSVRAEAAGALLAGFDNQPSLVGSEQTLRIATFLRAQLDAEPTPEPRFVELLGRVGNSEDFEQILRWLDHDVEAVKEAAAHAWVASNRSLAPLAQRASDPLIQAIVIPAATQRGSRAQTMLALISHKPTTEQFAAAWGRALVAMAPRVDPDALIVVDRKLTEQGESTDLRLQILSAAIDRLLADKAALSVTNFNVSERQIYTLQLMDLLLARAEARLSSGDGKAAMADLQRVIDLNVELAPSQQSRYDLTAIHAHVLSGELDEAFTLLGKHLAADPPTEASQAMQGKVVEVLLSCADRCLIAKQTDRAGHIVSRLRTSLPRPLSFELDARLTSIENRIKSAMP